jgi:hypothetical protein
VPEERRSEGPEIQVEIAADTTDIDEAWGEEEADTDAAPPPKPVAPPRPLPKPVVPPSPVPAASAPVDVTIEDDDPIEFEADYVSRDSMPTLPDANPLQYDVVPESERVTIPPAPRVPSLRRRRK